MNKNRKILLNNWIFQVLNDNPKLISIAAKKKGDKGVDLFLRFLLDEFLKDLGPAVNSVTKELLLVSGIKVIKE